MKAKKLNPAGASLLRSGSSRDFVGSVLGAFIVFAKNRGSGESVENLANLALNNIFAELLSEREFFDQKALCSVEHFALSKAQVLVRLEAEEVAHHFGDLVNASGLDLFHVLAVTTVPGLVVDSDFFGLEDLVDLGHVFFCDDRAQSDVFDLVGGDQDRATVFEELEDIEVLFLASDVLFLNAANDAHAVGRINRIVSDFENGQIE